MSLFWRIFGLNAVVLFIAMMLLFVGPVTVSTPILLAEASILGIGLLAMLVANALLLRIGLAPLERLGRVMVTTDLTQPGRRLRPTGRGEVTNLIAAFNTMLDRLETERATSTARALSAQEAERGRIARELHDEVGQTLTAVLLDLKRLEGTLPLDGRDDLGAVQESVRNSLDEIRRLARRLRPGVLEDLGLHSALHALSTELFQDGLRIRAELARELPPLDRDTELVLYRVAQEGLTNAVRHAGATEVVLSLRPCPDGVELRVHDDGHGIGTAPEGAGIQGMRERAMLVGASLTHEPAATGGTILRLRVPRPTEQS